eukprot:Hpha_TRINITY_DN14180_c0_g1::TRINITY_DN14180_c0_g1_i1::g.10612::m.10612
MAGEAAKGRRLQGVGHQLDEWHNLAKRRERGGIRREEIRRKEIKRHGAELRSRSAEAIRSAAEASEDAERVEGRIVVAAEARDKLLKLQSKVNELSDAELRVVLDTAAARRAEEKRQREIREERIRLWLIECAHIRVQLEASETASREEEEEGEAKAFRLLLRREEYERVAEQNRAVQAEIAAERAAQDKRRAAHREYAAGRPGGFANDLFIAMVGEEHRAPRCADLWAAALRQTPSVVTAAVDPRRGLRARMKTEKVFGRRRLRAGLAGLSEERLEHTRGLELCLLSRAADALPHEGILWRTVEVTMQTEESAVLDGCQDDKVTDVVSLVREQGEMSGTQATQALNGLDTLADTIGSEWEAIGRTPVDRAAPTLAAVAAQSHAVMVGRETSDDEVATIFDTLRPPSPTRRMPDPVSHPRWRGLIEGPEGPDRETPRQWKGLRHLWLSARKNCTGPPPTRQRPVFNGVASVLESADKGDRERWAAAQTRLSELRAGGKHLPSPPPPWMIAKKMGEGEVCVSISGKMPVDELWRLGVSSSPITIPRSTRPFAPNFEAHSGCLAAAMSIFEPVHAVLAAARRDHGAPLKLSFTGSGQGGAVATLLCLFYRHLALSDFQACRLATFGAPRVFATQEWFPGRGFPPLDGVVQNHYLAQHDVCPTILGSNHVRNSAGRLEELGLLATGKLAGCSSEVLRSFRHTYAPLYILEPQPEGKHLTKVETSQLDSEEWDHAVSTRVDTLTEAQHHTAFHHSNALPSGMAGGDWYLALIRGVVGSIISEDPPMGLRKGAEEGRWNDLNFLEGREGALYKATRSVLNAELGGWRAASRVNYPLLTNVVRSAGMMDHPHCWRLLGKRPSLRVLEATARDCAFDRVPRRWAGVEFRAAEPRRIIEESRREEHNLIRVADDVKGCSVEDLVEERGRTLFALERVFRAAAPEIRAPTPEAVATQWTPGGRPCSWCGVLRLARVAQSAAKGVGTCVEPTPPPRLSLLLRYWEERLSATNNAKLVATEAPSTITIWRCVRATHGAAFEADVTKPAELVKERFEEHRRFRAATRIQSLQRGIVARQYAATLRPLRAARLAAGFEAESVAYYNDAALLIIRTMKRYATRERCARGVQRWWRGEMGRDKAKIARKRQASEEVLQLLAEASLFSLHNKHTAVKIQRGARMFLATRKVGVKRRAMAAAEAAEVAAEEEAFTSADAASARIARYRRKWLTPGPERRRLYEFRAERLDLAKLEMCERRLVEGCYLAVMPKPPLRVVASEARQWTNDRIDSCGTNASVFDLEAAEVAREESLARRAIRAAAQAAAGALGECLRVAKRQLAEQIAWRTEVLNPLHEEEQNAIATAYEAFTTRHPRAGSARVRGGAAAVGKQEWFFREMELRNEYAERAERLLTLRRLEMPRALVTLLMPAAHAYPADHPARPAFLWYLLQHDAERIAVRQRELDDREALARADRDGREIVALNIARGGAAGMVRRRRRPKTAAGAVAVLLGDEDAAKRLRAMASKASFFSQASAELTGPPPLVVAAVEVWKTERNALCPPPPGPSRRLEDVSAAVRGERLQDGRTESAGLSDRTTPATTIDLRRIPGATEGDALRVLRDAVSSETLTSLALCGVQAGAQALNLLQRLLVNPIAPIRSLTIQSAAAAPGAVAALAGTAAKATTLRTLDLSGCVGLVTPVGLKALEAIASPDSSIAVLILNRCGIGDEGCRCVAPFAARSSAVGLEVDNNSLTDAAVRHLLRALYQRSSPFRLSIQNNPLSTVLHSEVNDRLRALGMHPPPRRISSAPSKRGLSTNAVSEW